MGVIKAFFRPLTNFLKFYKSMTQGTPEELARSSDIKRSGELYQQKFKEAEALISKTQADMMSQVTKRVEAFRSTKKAIQDHEEIMYKLGMELRDPDSDKERIFAEMQRLGIQFDDSGMKLTRSEELMAQLHNIGTAQAVVDLKPIAEALQDLESHTIASQHKMRELTDAISFNPHVKPDEIIEAATKDALSKGVDPAVIAKVTADLKQSGKKQL